jgi:Zn-dependent protease with chaperone function
VSIALVLLGYVTVLACAGPWVLRRGWADRLPALAVAGWQALTASVVGAVVLAGVALAVPTPLVSIDLAEVLDACVLALRAQYATPGGAAVGSGAAVLALTVVVRCTYSAVRELAASGGQRRRHHDALALLGRPDPRLGAVILDHRLPAAYCLPGRGRRIVLTTAALDALDDDQLQAVLAHERAHLAARHDLAVAGALAFERAFPKVALFRIARMEIERLVELLADDAAVRTSEPVTLAEALLTIAEGAGGAHPAGALAAGGGSATAARIRRLITGAPRPASRPQVTAGLTVIAGLLALPILLVAAPAATTMPRQNCDVPDNCAAMTLVCAQARPGRHSCPIP